MWNYLARAGVTAAGLPFIKELNKPDIPSLVSGPRRLKAARLGKRPAADCPLPTVSKIGPDPEQASRPLPAKLMTSKRQDLRALLDPVMSAA